jgi:hypothetical protein
MALVLASLSGIAIICSFVIPEPLPTFACGLDLSQSVSATFTAAAAGNVRLTLLQDGVEVPGATAAETITTATTEIANIGIVAVVRVQCCDTSALSVRVDGTTAPTISSMAIKAVKVI